jgi:hypothetical protein
MACQPRALSLSHDARLVTRSTILQPLYMTREVMSGPPGAQSSLGFRSTVWLPSNAGLRGARIEGRLVSKETYGRLSGPAEAREPPKPPKNDDVRKLAKKLAALEALRALRAAGRVDEHLVPTWLVQGRAAQLGEPTLWHLCGLEGGGVEIRQGSRRPSGAGSRLCSASNLPRPPRRAAGRGVAVLPGCFGCGAKAVGCTHRLRPCLPTLPLPYSQN